MPTTHQRTTAADRRLRVLADVARGLDLDGAPPAFRDLAAHHGVSYRTAKVDVDELVAAGLLRRLGAHQPRQRARLAVTETGRRTLALASQPAPATSPSIGA